MVIKTRQNLIDPDMQIYSSKWKVMQMVETDPRRYKIQQTIFQIDIRMLIPLSRFFIFS